ncbi:restriction endonuclease subunit S [Lactobacillus ruminis]|nr:restriction endonuclease subunit S [Ligilactobacillus ruminis]
MGELLISLQNNTLSRAELSDELGVAKNIHYGDVLIKFGNVLDVSKERFPMISDEGVLEKYKESFLKNGDVIVADTAEDSTVGKCSEISGLNDEVVLSGLHTIPYRPIEKFAFGYLGYYLNSSAYHDQLIPLMQGIKVTSISKSAMKDTEIVYPKSVEEQGKVAEYFRNLDRLITLHQQKITLLTKLKKAMLEKMFPKKGSVIPEIRFNGFANAWEQRKVSELFRVTRGYVLAATQTETEKTDEKPYPVYSSQTKDKGLMGYYKDYLYEDAITWTTDGANAGTVNYRAGKFYCTNVCGVLLSNEVKANQMIAEALNNVAKGYVSYVGNPKLMNNVMADIVIQIPTHPEEREQISSFFANLDHLITLHQRKIDKLKNLKKAMLDQMFI